MVPELRWHLVQARYIQYATYHVTLDIDGKKEVIRHDLARYGARDTEKVKHVGESALPRIRPGLYFVRNNYYVVSILALLGPRWE